MESEKYEEAVRDYEKVCKMDRSRGKESRVHDHRLKLLFLCYCEHLVLIQR